MATVLPGAAPLPASLSACNTGSMAGPPAVAGRAESTYFARAIVDSRSTLHLSYRLAVRFGQWTLLEGAAGPGAGVWRAALPAFVVLDVVTWWVLRGTDQFGIGWRLPLDCADIAFWSLSLLPASRTYDIAMLLGIPLAVEAGFRWGRRALLVPVAIAAVVASVRALASEPPNPFTASWLLLGVGLGMAVFSYCRRLDQQARAERERQRVADAQWAFMAGENEVAMGADSVVDVIEGLVPVLGRPGQGSALWTLADGWKARLAADTSAHAAYLRLVLLRWASAHNRHPDLATQVRVTLDDEGGTTILTSRQVAWLQAALDQQCLSGEIHVSIVSGTHGRMPGTALDLEIDGRRVRVPEDRATAIRPVETGPVTYGLIAAQVLGFLPRGRGAVPLVAAGCAVTVCGAAAWWSHRQVLARGRGARGPILVAAIAASFAVTTILCSHVTDPLTVDGDTVYIGLGPMLLAFLGGLYGEGLPRRFGVLVATAAAGNVGLVLLLSPGPVNLRSLLGSMALSVAPYPACRHISRSLARATERHFEATAAADERARQAAFQRGQESVMTLVRLARDDAWAQLTRVAPELDPNLSALVGARLEEVDRRLLSLTAAAESSSSTTTS